MPTVHLYRIALVYSTRRVVAQGDWAETTFLRHLNDTAPYNTNHELIWAIQISIKQYNQMEKP